MAYAADSKSAEGNFMWVRLPPPAPLYTKSNTLNLSVRFFIAKSYLQLILYKKLFVMLNFVFNKKFQKND